MPTRRSVLEALGVGGLCVAGPGLSTQSTVATAATAGETLFHADFESASTGAYEPISGEWGGLPLDVVTSEFFAVEADADGAQYLDARFPASVEGAGNTNGGGDFIVDLDDSYEELYCAYRVRFDEGFEFDQPGGKLPGLAGTNVDDRSITGGDEPTGENGWSARMMWRDPPNPDQGGLVMFYTYHPDMPGEYGENMYWDDGPSGQVHFEPGEWHRIEHRVVMNSPGAPGEPGEQDGVLEGWFDGEKAFERTDLRFRDVPELGIDDFYFSLFFGGGQTEHWAHDREEHVQFDDVAVATEPIWLGDDEPPAQPTGLTATATEETTVELSWAGADDDGPSGVDHYRVTQNGRERETVPAGTTSATVERVIAGETHEFGVAAVDVAGNASEPATVGVTTDPLADETPLALPQSLQQVGRQLDWIEIEWRPPDAPDAEGGASLAHYEVAIAGDDAQAVAGDDAQAVAGDDVQAVDSGDTLRVDPEQPRARLGELDPGSSYDVSVRTVDLAGNRSEAATVTAHTVPESPPDALVVNSFEDGRWPGENQVGNWAGAGDFENGEGEVVAGAGTAAAGALRLEYDDGGWFRSRLEGEHDVSEYDQLTLLVRGDAGGEQRHCTIEIGDVGGVLADLTDDEVRQRWTAVRIDLDAVDAPAEPAYVYGSFGEGSAGAVEIDEIRFDHADATGGDEEPDDPCEAATGEPAAASAEVDGQTVCDVDGDGAYMDVTGDGAVTNTDVTEFFANQHAPAWDDRPGLFDFDGDESVGQSDVVALFEHVVG